MNNINVKVVGTANVQQMQSAFGKLETQVALLNTQLASTVNLTKMVDAAGYARLAKYAAINDKYLRNAVDSTGTLERQQLRLNSATGDYIKKLQAQKVSLRETLRGIKDQKSMYHKAYQEQLRMEKSMVARRGAVSNSFGKQAVDVIWSRQIAKGWDTAANRLAYFNEHLKSSSEQMINWGKNTQWAGRQLMVGFTIPVAAFGAAAGVMAYQVDKQLTRIAKVYDTTASEGIAKEKELMEVRKQSMETAIAAARAYGSAATDTLDVQAELAATGVTGAALQESTAQVMKIARLGELEYQDAIQATISLQSVFKQNTDELAASFDFMNSVENATSLQTKDFAQAIPIAAAPVREFGGDIQELGILLTAMKERGIAATQGANAIKAAMQRLGRPSKQVQEEWKAITGTDITKIFEDSTSLIDLFQRIAEATRGLDNKERIKAFAGLFGTYQVTRMSALVEGMRDLEQGTGQVSAAFRIANQDASEWAKTSAEEIRTYQESISGMWDTAFQEFKVQLSTFGKPFVKVATQVIEIVNDLMKAFNGLPGFFKNLIAIPVALTAIAGPVIMLTGLFGNLFGQSQKGLALLNSMIVKWTGGMKIATAEQRAAALQAELNTGYLSKEAKATELLRMELQKLTAAQIQANQAARRARVADLVAGGMSRSQAYAQLAAERRAELRATGKMDSAGRSVRASVTGTDVDNAKRLAVNWKKIGIYAGTAATSAALMFAAQDGAVGKIAQLVFYGSLLAPLVAPIAPLLVKGFKSANAWAMTLGKTMKGNLAVATATAAVESGAVGGAHRAGAHRGVGRTAAAVGGMATAAATGARAIASFLGPIGLIGIGVTTIGYGLYKWVDAIRDAKREEELLRKSQESGRAELLDATEKWAAAVGKAYGNYKLYNEQVKASLNNQTNAGYLDSVQRWSEMETTIEGPDGQTKTVNLADNFNTGDERYKDLTLMQMLVDMISAVGLEASEAKKEMTAFLDATGLSTVEATNKIDQLFELMGDNPYDLNWRELITKQIEFALDDTQSMLERSAAAKNLGNLYPIMLDNARDPAEVQAYLEGIKGMFLQNYSVLQQQILAELQQQGMGPGQLADILGLDLEQVEKMFSDVESFRSAILDNQFREKIFTQIGVDDPKAMQAFADAANNLELLEEGFYGTAGQARGLGEDIDQLGEFMSSLIVKFDGLTKRQRIQETNQMISSIKELVKDAKRAENLGGLFSSVFAEKGNEQVTSSMNELASVINTFINLKDLSPVTRQLLKNWGEWQGINFTGIASGVDKVKKAQEELLHVAKEDAFNMRRSVMESIQQDIADMLQEDFDNRMNASLEARADYWEKRQKAQSDLFEKQQEQLDKKWEKKNDAAEKYWDRRIERVRDAIEAEEKAEDKRQRMFDAEIARIERLNEAMNRNIDFNVALNEGNLDEAARIRNGVNAQVVQTALERAAERSARRSANRRDRLEGRIENIEEKREVYMKRLKKREDAERKHLDNIQEIRRDALQEQQEDNMKALNDYWEAEKKQLDERLENLQKFTARNEKELKEHLKKVGISYDQFSKILKKKGETWGSFYGESLRKHVKNAARELRNDRIWESLGKESFDEIVKGMGFSSKRSFKHFVRTGEMKDFGTNKPLPGDSRETGLYRHEGGWADGSAGSRKGVARTLKGLHQNEMMIRAQKGEFVVNKHAAAKNGPLLESINSGNDMGGIGLVGAPAAAATAGLFTGTKQAAKRAVRKRNALNAAQSARLNAAGNYGTRNYGLSGVKPWVAEAANYLGNKFNISSIGGYRDSSTSVDPNGHPAGLALDFMTSSFSQGDALAREVIRLRGPLDALYAIWKQRIIGGSYGWNTWRPMSDRGSPTANHMDHVHVSFLSNGDVGDLPSLGGPMGRGGSHKPINARVTSGVHDTGTAFPGIDFAAPRGTKVYAVGDGRITTSRDIPGPLSTDRYNGDGPYGSYGRYMILSLNKGGSVLYAHLDQRGFGVGKRVKGGTVIGRSGNTGNSSGPHLHFGASNGNPMAYLKKGGTVKYDNTPAILHKNERVLTAPLTNKLDTVVDAMYRAVKGGTTGGTNDGTFKPPKKKSKFKYPGLGMGAADYPYTWFDYGKNKKRRAPKNATLEPGKIKAGTYNSGTGSTSKLRADLKRLMPMVDVLSLQEMTTADARLKPWFDQMGWGWFNGGHQGTGLLWNKSSVSMSKGGSKELSPPGVSRGHRYAAYAKFQKKGGPAWWQIAAHTVAWPYKSKARRAEQTRQFLSLRALWQNLSKNGTPVIIGGDLNESIQRGDWIKKIGLGPGTNSGPGTHGKSWLDHLLFTGLVGGKSKVIKGLSSDHNALINSFSIPGFADGGKIRWDNTIANLHKDERVLAAPQTADLERGLRNFANGGNVTYNAHVYVTNADVDAEDVANIAIKKIQRIEARRPTSRRG